VFTTLHTIYEFVSNILSYLYNVGILIWGPINRHFSGRLNFSNYHCRCSSSTVCVHRPDRFSGDSEPHARRVRLRHCSPKCCTVNASIAEVGVLCGVESFLFPFLHADPSPHCYIARLDSFIINILWVVSPTNNYSNITISADNALIKVGITLLAFMCS